ncbi:hypothetical protein E4U60_001891 [Claviceps pazoutovae]|uniref:Uncharacterized protein n=1 Tax=Claviceps pazoutovae TaxID=1649127 RepID=A0A9P7MCA2_9HYPO|nr:hypothetical protein E4U60_001891 [Claviceps pazoutovae]
MRSYHDAGHLAGIAQQALSQMDSLSLGDRIIKTEPQEDSPMSEMSPCGPSHTDAYVAPGPRTIKAEPEEDSPMSGLNGLPPTNPSNPPEFGHGGFHADKWEDWLSQRKRNYARKQPVQQQQTPSDDDDDEDPLASWRSLAAAPDPLPMDIKVEEEARVLEVFGNTLSAWSLPPSQYNMGYEYPWPSTPRGLSEPVFCGTVHQEPSHEATERAREIHGAGSSLSHVVMWTGTSTSRRTHGGGYAVASLYNGEGWRVMCRREGHPIGRLWMSLQSIALAVEVALQHVTVWQPTPFVGTTVRIFTSDTDAIKALKTLPLCAMNTSMIEASQTISVLEEIAAISRNLSELGATLEVFWAPRGKHPGYKVARAASVYASSTPDGRNQDSWAFPDKDEVVEALDEDASANIKAEMEEKVKTEVKAEVKEEIKAQVKVEIKAQVKDDDDDMSSLDLKTEKELEVDDKWWQRLSCC